MAELKKLFEPIKVGQMELKNRIVALAMGTGYAKDAPNERYKNFVLEIARGGTGLVITSVSPVPGGGQLGGGEILVGIYDDAFIPELKDLTRKTHSYGAKIAAQVLVMDEVARSKDAHPELVGPSPVAKRSGAPVPRALEVEEIHRIAEEIGTAARRARGAGFDAVEVHAGIGFLINQFLSPATNKRTDAYGGSVENRMRFLMETIRSIQEKAGGDYPLLCRISAEEFMPGGLTLEDTRKIAPLLEKAGVHCLDVQAGWHESPVPLVQMSVPRGAFVHLSTEIKKVVQVPVVAAYRITDALMAEDIVAQGKADLVGMARALIADPEFPNKAREGRLEDIRPCIACCYCLDVIFSGKPLACSVNARTGREREYQITPAPQPKKVLVIGGGPAGMEAARVAALRGHKVTLWDSQKRLGGNLLAASLPPHKEEIAPLVPYFETQLQKNGVKVKLGKKATPAAVVGAKPDAVIVAAGAGPIVPDIPGIRGDNVATALEVLQGKEVGEKVVIVGGGMIGCETAEFLVERGKKVIVLEMLPRIGNDIGIIHRWVVLGRLRKAGVRMETKAKAMEITPRGVIAQRDGATELFEGDTVVIAVGMKPNKELIQQLQGKVPTCYAVGDCVEAQRIAQAVEAGMKAALGI